MLTSYYQSKRIDPAKHFVVQTSNGRPRFGVVPEARADLLMPPPALVQAAHDGLAEEEFVEQYILHLERAGYFEISLELERLESLAGGREVVLCCFEALKKPGQYCHRRMFAEWWQGKTGEAITEI